MSDVVFIASSYVFFCVRDLATSLLLVSILGVFLGVLGGRSYLKAYFCGYCCLFCDKEASMKWKYGIMEWDEICRSLTLIPHTNFTSC